MRTVARRAGIAHQAQQRLPQRPAARTRPGLLVEPDRRAEHLPRRAPEEGPGDHQVAGRIADPAGAEVDDRGEPTLAGQQVSDGHVTVEPHVGPVPRRGQRCLPDAVVVEVELRQAAAGLVVVRRERAAAEEAVRAGPWALAGVHSHGAPRGTRPGRRANRSSSMAAATGVPVDPAADRPRAREVGGRGAERDRFGHRQRQLRGEHGQPALLLVDRRHVGLGRGQAHRELGPEPVGAVVPAVRLDRHDRQVAPTAGTGRPPTGPPAPASIPARPSVLTRRPSATRHERDNRFSERPGSPRR